MLNQHPKISCQWLISSHLMNHQWICAFVVIIHSDPSNQKKKRKIVLLADLSDLYFSHSCFRHCIFKMSPFQIQSEDNAISPKLSLRWTTGFMKFYAHHNWMVFTTLTLENIMVCWMLGCQYTQYRTTNYKKVMEIGGQEIIHGN